MSSKVKPKSRNGIFALALIGIAVVGFSWPMFYAQGQKRKEVTLNSPEPLPKQAAIRGAFVNSGSRDVGPDPNKGKFS
jgi:hypothetical protein